MNYVGGAPGATVDPGIAVSDIDNTTLASATVSLTAGSHPGDTLSFANDGSTMGDVTAPTTRPTGSSA